MLQQEIAQYSCKQHNKQFTKGTANTVYFISKVSVNEWPISVTKIGDKFRNPIAEWHKKFVNPIALHFECSLISIAI